MNASAIRAGKAFVEMYIDDESVQASLNRVRSRLHTLGGTITAVGNQSFSAMNTAATAATVASTVGLVRTTGAVATLKAGVGVLTASVVLLATTFQATFRIATNSVLTARLGLGALTFAIDRFAKGTKLQGLLDGFLNRSQQTEAAGRWTGFWGAMSGNPAIRNFGNRIERLGLAASVTRAFRSGGITSGVSAAFGAAFRSARSGVVQGGLSLVSGFFRGSAAAVKSSAAVIVPALDQTTDAAGRTQVSLTKASGAARVVSVNFAAAARMVAGTALKVAGLAAVISGPAFLAVRNYAAGAQEMLRVSQETGESLDQLIKKKYGGNSLISPADIQAAGELGDSMTLLRQTVAAVWAQIAAAALPTVRKMTESSFLWATAIVRLIRDNRQLIGNVVSVAARVATIAAAIAAVAGGLLALGPAVSLLLSPLGLVTAGVGLLAYLFPELRNEAAAVFQWLFGNFGELLTVVQETLGGIQDALMGGDIKAAADVLWAGLKLAWLAGTEQLRDVWRQATNNLAKYGVDAFSSLRAAWVTTTQFLGDAWAVVLNGMRGAWTATQNWFANGFARVIAKMTGQNADEVLATLNEMQQQEASKNEQAFANAMNQREQLAQKKLADIEAERLAMQGSLDEELAGRQTAAAAELAAARASFAQARETARAARPELDRSVVSAAAGPAKQKRADQERRQELASSGDIRSAEGLQLVLKNLLGTNAAEQTATNTAKTVQQLGAVTVKLDKSNEHLDRLWREQGNDIIGLNAALGVA